MLGGNAEPRAVAGLDTASDRMHIYCDTGFYQSGSAKGDPLTRRYRLHHQAKQIFQQLPRGTMLVIEEPLALKNGKTTRLLGMACGAIESAAYDLDLFIYYADVSAWKKTVVGKGNAAKEDIVAWVREHMQLDFGDGKAEADYYDAAALAEYGRLQLQS